MKGDEYMELLVEKFEQIRKIDVEWKKLVKDAQNQNVMPENKDLIRAFNELFTTAQASYKANVQETEKTFQQYMPDDFHWLLDDVKKSLEFFFTLSELRELQNKNEDKAKKIIDFLFDNVIVYFDRQFANMYNEFGFETLESFFDTARALDTLTEYYVSQHLPMNAINIDLKSETEFSDNICKYLTDKIRENYQTLQLKIVMDMLQMERRD